MILFRPEFVFVYGKKSYFDWHFTPVEVNMDTDPPTAAELGAIALKDRIEKIEQRLEVIDEAIDRLGKVVTRGYIPLDTKLKWRDE